MSLSKRALFDGEVARTRYPHVKCKRCGANSRRRCSIAQQGVGIRSRERFDSTSPSGGLAKIMPLQNRVTPMGDIVAVPERGSFTGNRGIIHDPQSRTLLQRRWACRAWLICTLHWRDVRRSVMATRSWTELFFLDEATALAAGHRPCFFCRRKAAQTFQHCFPRHGRPAAPRANETDTKLHAERLEGRRKRLHVLTSPVAELPDGTMILQDGLPHLMLDGRPRPWSFGGYGDPVMPGVAQLITPPSTVAVLTAGYRPDIHASAFGEGRAPRP